MYTVSLVAITPLPMKDFAETMGLMLGHSGQEFAIPLTSDGTTETHKALHAWVTPEYSKYWTGEAYPEGADPAAVDWVRSELIISLQEGATPIDHFNEVLTANSLETLNDTPT
jgi:hypothetical protein